jgi:small subunit ribosomal protein S6e
MAKFKIVLSDPEVGTSQMMELEGSRAVPLVGRRLGDLIDGTAVGMAGHKLRITGGSDKDGFPMRPDIHGGVKTRVVIAGGVGFHSHRHGERRRKTLRGSVITEEIFQVNMKIVEKPAKKAKAKPLREAEAEKTEKATSVKTKPVTEEKSEEIMSKTETASGASERSSKSRKNQDTSGQPSKKAAKEA